MEQKRNKCAEILEDQKHKTGPPALPEGKASRIWNDWLIVASRTGSRQRKGRLMRRRGRGRRMR
jgi:hypothetical protein